jgi:hypothetical protein
MASSSRPCWHFHPTGWFAFHFTVNLINFTFFSHRRISTWLALVVGLGLVNALGALHKIGFIHRYVTPWNFMLPTPFNTKDIVNKTICMDLSLATKWTEK